MQAPLDGRMSIDLGRQRLPLPEPLSPDHQLLRIQQGRQIIVGLRSEAARIAAPSQARPGEVALSGIVEHVEYQGHEALVHLNTGSQPAVVPELESARADRAAPRRRRAVGGSRRCWRSPAVNPKCFAGRAGLCGHPPAGTVRRPNTGVDLKSGGGRTVFP